ncbi:MAG: DNA-deoxyinosine glycosylase [Lachnospiraceae bacterium]
MKKQTQWQAVTHTFGPVYDSRSQILILGSFPSVKSRQQQFYYGHPQNRFWKLLARIFGEENVPDTIPKKKTFLLQHRIAVWDVIESCEIIGSSDSSIRNVTPNDIAGLLEQTQIKTIFCNGTKSYELFQRYVADTIKDASVTVEKLPSTSPANAAWKLERLETAWAVVRDIRKEQR